MSKTDKKSITKPTVNPQEIIGRAKNQFQELNEQIGALKTFCVHTEEGDSAYDFSVAMANMLELIQGSIGAINETLDEAGAQKGGAE